MMGYTEPRIYTPPMRELDEHTSLGFAACEYARDVLGKTLYPWQEWALQHMLEITGELGKEWHFRYRTILIMVSRQCGKTVLSEVLASFFLTFCVLTACSALRCRWTKLKRYGRRSSTTRSPSRCCPVISTEWQERTATSD